MSTEMRQYIETCATNATFSDKQQQESKVITGVPPKPWQKVASDLLAWGGNDYLICTDCHCNFFEVDVLSETTSGATIAKLKYFLPVMGFRKHSPVIMAHSTRRHRSVHSSKNGRFIISSSAPATARLMVQVK